MKYQTEIIPERFKGENRPATQAEMKPRNSSNSSKKKHQNTKLGRKPSKITKTGDNQTEDGEGEKHGQQPKLQTPAEIRKSNKQKLQNPSWVKYKPEPEA